MLDYAFLEALKETMLRRQTVHLSSESRCSSQQCCNHCCHIFTTPKFACMDHQMLYLGLSCLQMKSSCHSCRGFATLHPGNRASYPCNHLLGVMAWQTMPILCRKNCPALLSLSAGEQSVPKSWHSLNCARFVSQAQSHPPISMLNGLCTFWG